MVDGSRLEIVVLHAPLDPQDRAIVPETQVRRRRLLEMKQEQVVLPAREIMQFVANPVDKIERLTPPLKLPLAQEVPVQKPPLEHRGVGAQVLRRHPGTVLEGADAMADVKADVPEERDQEMDEGIDRPGDGGRV